AIVAALVIVLAFTLKAESGITLAVFNESPVAIRAELWQHKDLIFLGDIAGNRIATCTLVPPGDPLVVRVHITNDKTLENRLDLYYETGYTGAIRVYFENDEITYEDELELPGPSFGPPPKARRRS